MHCHAINRHPQLTTTVSYNSSQTKLSTYLLTKLTATLLSLPYTMQNLDHFKTLFRRLKDVKEFFPSGVREHQKKCFLNAIEECI